MVLTPNFEKIEKNEKIKIFKKSKKKFLKKKDFITFAIAFA